MKKLLVVFVGAILLLGLLLPVSAFAKIDYKWGWYERARYEFWKNLFDTNNDTKDNRGYFWFKTSVWGQADFSKDISVYAKLTNSNKAYTYWYQSASGKKGYRYDINEVFVDNLYLDLKDFLQLPVDLRLGRQDFLGTYGEGFILMDGTPGDGSRSFYFNAAKATWKIDKKNTLDFLYMNDPRDDDNLPIINKQSPENVLASSHEWASGLYHKNDAFKNLHWENYYLYKGEKGTSAAGAAMTRQTTRLSTIGSFAKYNFAPSWAVRAQFAGQFGSYGDNKRQGLGGYAYLDKDFKDAKWSPSASIGYLYLSGDDTKTTRNEGWDPIFSRWPWISELYVLSIAADAEAGYWTNLNAVRASFVLRPTSKTKLSLWYNYLRANENTASTTVLSGTGKTRGHLPQARLDYKINKNINTYVLAEYLIPGNFYAKKDQALFCRYELELKF
ncbi:MAG TPA: alginate export family protein [Patescibacteria group bacterium]|nr:alginate export family protein [Patescibacteria group bacterium]